MAGSVSRALFQDQPVQTLGHSEWPEGRLRRLALAARGLARAERLGSRSVAERVARECAEREPSNYKSQTLKPNVKGRARAANRAQPPTLVGALSIQKRFPRRR